jgi:hypothetical protein
VAFLDMHRRCAMEARHPAWALPAETEPGQREGRVINNRGFHREETAKERISLQRKAKIQRNNHSRKQERQ